ncbi:MAG: hypothetical protein DCC43_10095 [Candidatus Brocadia sp.]|nr:hypothetical protein [Candidatus Brocadia fulgida]MCC6326806.1 hypothetical protein [Candidatus Brocadia sp.]MCE7912387.1 hypothetical protein [Candidatus Brocadia sp. AMX3]MDG5995819.1 hypothetical protein [Candidatus Brocadia sp.]RIJ97584.1 MAG: hypothetical protein DCC43_10095 [Candidatus Brocadia sp.]
MPYLEEDDLEVFEDDEALLETEDDTEKWEETFGEARYPRYRRGRATRLPSRRVGGLKGGSINTPAGRAQFKFEKPVATRESVDNLAKELRTAIKKVDETLDKNTSMLDKKVNAIDATLKKGQQQTQQMSMMSILPLLLTKPPQIEKIKLGEVPKEGLVKDAEVPIQTTTFKKDDGFFLIFALMAMMPGGLGGGTGDSSNMMPLVLAMALK